MTNLSNSWILIGCLLLSCLFSQCKNDDDDRFQILVDPTDSTYALHREKFSGAGNSKPQQTWVYYMRADGYPAAAEHMHSQNSPLKSSETVFENNGFTVIGDHYSLNSDTVVTSHLSQTLGIEERYTYNESMLLEKVNGVSPFGDRYRQTYSYDQDGNVIAIHSYHEAVDLGPPMLSDAVVTPSNTPTAALPYKYIPNRAAESPNLRGRVLLHRYSYDDDSALVFEYYEVTKMQYEQRGDTFIRTTYRWEVDSPEDSVIVRNTDKYWREELEPRRMIIWPE